MKIITLFLVLFFSAGNLITNAQKYFTKTGHAYFMSHTDAIDIDGNNYQVGSFLDIGSGEMVFSVLIKAFEFTLATAEEHFNETYMESAKFPKASFKGKILDISDIDLTKPGKYNVNVEGDMTIHGITKHISEKGTLEVKDGKIHGSSAFKVSISDYGITVPGAVEHRVAKIVDISVDLVYEPYISGSK